MQTRDHSSRQCAVLYNCADMFCLNEHPDQSKIYYIQAGKQAKSNEEYEALLRRSQEVDNPNAARKTYEKTPKMSKASKVDREQGLQEEIVEEKNNTTQGSNNSHVNSSINNLKWPKDVVDNRHSLNPKDDDSD